MLIHVLDTNRKPLMPCRSARARRLVRKGDAMPFYQKGIFCIRLLREPSNRSSQPIALGLDTGSKREAFTAATAKAVVLNITTNTPSWVKEHVETRRNLRRSRRYRKTPYRACRENRSVLRNANRIPPSTLARWNAKLRIIRLLQTILPISIVNVEDIAAITKEGKTKWNTSFSPLEVGKSWFYSEIEKLGMQLLKTEGFDTKKHRDLRGFVKSKDKLAYAWHSHNVDSHSLAEMALQTQIEPFLSLYKIQYLEYHRRQLHVMNAAKGGIRKQYGGTISLGLPRGSTVRYRGKLGYIGGSSNDRVSVHDVKTSKRLTQHAKIEDIQMLYTSKFTTQYKRGGIPPTVKTVGLLPRFS